VIHKVSGVSLLRVLGGIAGLAVAVTGCGGSAGSRPAASPGAAAVAAELRGGVLSPPDREPALELTDTAGRSYDVEARTAGTVTLVYFGYTHCPDVCPTTMADIAQALRESAPQVRRKVRVVFVTVDPHRDSGAVLRRWLDHYNPEFVGLRGSLRQVVEAQREAGIPVSRVETNGKAIEHSAEILAYTPDHVLHVLYNEGPSTIDDLRHDLPILTTAAAYA
jgi:protein SCO1/2